MQIICWDSNIEYHVRERQETKHRGQVASVQIKKGMVWKSKNYFLKILKMLSKAVLEFTIKFILH